MHKIFFGTLLTLLMIPNFAQAEFSRYFADFVITEYHYPGGQGEFNQGYFASEQSPYYEFIYKENQIQQGKIDPYVDSVLYFDYNGASKVDDFGFHAWRFQYDQDRFVTEIRTLDLNGMPVGDRSGVAGVRFKYDEAGNEVGIAYLDIYSDLINTVAGWALVRKEFVWLGNKYFLSAEEFYNKDKEAAVGPDGVPRAVFEYDRQYRIVFKRFYNLERKPIANHQGVAVWEYSYDEAGKKYIQPYNIQGLPMLQHMRGQTVPAPK